MKSVRPALEAAQHTVRQHCGPSHGVGYHSDGDRCAQGQLLGRSNGDAADNQHGMQIGMGMGLGWRQTSQSRG